MRKFALILLAVVAVIVAGCGGGHSTHKTVLHLGHPPAATKPCQGQEYVMQCVATGHGKFGLRGAVAPPQTFRGLDVLGIDFAWGGPSAGLLRAHGVRFGVSYLSFSGDSKDWRDSQIADYLANGVGVVFVHETTAARTTGGCSAGVADAHTDQALLNGYASRLRRPSITQAPVFAATDFDTSGYGASSSVGQYYRCYRLVLGSRAGAYGGYNTMAIAHANGLRRLWQTLAWSYGRKLPGVCLYQSSINLTWFGYGIDFDHAYCSDYGQVGATRPKPPPPKLICFGPHASLKNATCKKVRPEVAGWSRARDSSRRAYKGQGCPKSKRPLCAVLAQRVKFFDGKARSTFLRYV